ncbi:MAG: hypothetical protein AAF211_16280 [Myxococcota bacterium]
MPKWAIDAIAAVAGLAVGAGLAVVAGPGGLGASDTCSDHLTTLRAEHEASNQKAEGLVASAKALREQVAQVEGPTLEWPPGVPEMETEAGYVKLLDEAVAKVGNAEKLGLECSEYPCIATIRFNPGTSGEAGLAALQGELQSVGFDTYQALSGGTTLAHPYPNGDDHEVRVFALIPPEANRPKGTSQRVGVRINRLVKSQIEAAGKGDYE